MIKFEGKTYPTKWVDVKGWGEHYIGVESLEEALIHDGEFVSKDAEWLDERIFFYVPDEEFDREDLGDYIAGVLV